MKWAEVVQVTDMLLTGTFVRNLDEKQRLSIPRPVRQSLGDPTHNVFYLAPGTDGSLALYPESSFAALAQQLSQASPTGSDVRAFSRLFYAQAQRMEMDRQGRLRVPSELAALAGFGKEIVMIGVRDHLELWDRRRWDEYLLRQQSRYDEIAESAFECQVLRGPSNGDTNAQTTDDPPGRPQNPR